MRKMLAGLLLAASPCIVSCAQAPAPEPGRPTTVAAAAEATLALLDEQSRKELAYLRDDELGALHHGFGMTVRAQLDLWNNPGLLKDCKSRHPEECSMEVIERLHSRLRAGLPAAERAQLEKLESLMDRVKLPARDFSDAPLSGFVAFLQAAVDAQLPVADRFRIQFEPRDAGHLVSVEVPEGSLYELYGNDFTRLDFTKAPPDLRVAPYFRPLEGIPADGRLEVAYSTAQGLREETRVLIRDAAAWQEMWSRLAASSGDAVSPVIDFTKYSAWVIALGERPTGGYEISAEPQGLHRSDAVITVRESRPGAGCMIAQVITYPTAVFLLPRIATGVRDLEGISERDCSR